MIEDDLSGSGDKATELTRYTIPGDNWDSEGDWFDTGDNSSGRTYDYIG